MTTHDFQQTRWGHNLEIKPTAEPDGFEGFCWCTPGPQVGDYLVWRTRYGTCVAEVTESRWITTVDDMHRIKGRVIERKLEGQ